VNQGPAELAAWLGGVLMCSDADDANNLLPRANAILTRRQLPVGSIHDSGPDLAILLGCLETRYLRRSCMDPRLRELITLSALAALGCGLAATQNDLFFVALFGAASVVTIIEAIRCW
jgi:alkylhydroperoxidase/carboxymuconolactone decarboxylase family protein YurZ